MRRYPDMPRVPPFREPRDPVLHRQLNELRRRGHGGGVIPKHRAMLTSPLRLYYLAPSIGLSFALFLAWLLVMRWVTQFWAQVLDFWVEVLGLGAFVSMVPYELGGTFLFEVPYVGIQAGLPDYATLWFGGLLTLALVLISFAIPRSYLPFVYLMRVAAFFQTTAEVFFAVSPRTFPYDAGGYIHGTLVSGLALISFIPIILGFTYYIFDFGILRKVALSVFIMAYLVILIPMQYLAHAYILHHLSLLFLPVLFFMFGLPLNVLGFVALYSWGTSWKKRGS